MIITLVYIHVKEETIEAFKQASSDNAAHSIQEAGIAQFDVIQQKNDPTRFVLIEVYKDDEAPAKHKETAHYLHWKQTVESMMAESRTHNQYINVFPDESKW